MSTPTIPLNLLPPPYGTREPPFLSNADYQELLRYCDDDAYGRPGSQNYELCNVIQSGDFRSTYVVGDYDPTKLVTDPYPSSGDPNDSGIELGKAGDTVLKVAKWWPDDWSKVIYPQIPTDIYSFYGWVMGELAARGWAEIWDEVKQPFLDGLFKTGSGPAEAVGASADMRIQVKKQIADRKTQAKMMDAPSASIGGLAPGQQYSAFRAAQVAEAMDSHKHGQMTWNGGTFTFDQGVRAASAASQFGDKWLGETTLPSMVVDTAGFSDDLASKVDVWINNVVGYADHANGSIIEGYEPKRADDVPIPNAVINAANALALVRGAKLPLIRAKAKRLRLEGDSVMEGFEREVARTFGSEGQEGDWRSQLSQYASPLPLAIELVRQEAFQVMELVQLHAEYEMKLLMMCLVSAAKMQQLVDKRIEEQG